MFFLISGFLFKTNDNFKNFFIKQFKRFIIPYYIFSIITYIFWITVGGRYGIGLISEIGYTKPLIGTILGLSHNDYLVHDISLWFLYVLFLIEIIYFFLLKIKNIKIIVIISIILSFSGYFISNILKMKLIYGIEKVLVGQIFFLIGIILRRINYQVIIRNLNIYKIIYLTIIMVLINLFFLKINGFVDLVGNLFGNNYLIYILNGIVGSLIVINLSLIFEKTGISNRVFEIVSKSTIYILGFHEQIISLIFGGIFVIFKIPPDTYKNIFLINIIISAGDCLLIAGIYYFVVKLKLKPS